MKKKQFSGGDMAKQQYAVRKSAFGELDELTRDLAKLAHVVNARFVVDATKLKELRIPKARLAAPKKRGTKG
jgi:hypothetical protein